MPLSVMQGGQKVFERWPQKLADCRQQSGFWDVPQFLSFFAVKWEHLPPCIIILIMWTQSMERDMKCNHNKWQDYIPMWWCGFAEKCDAVWSCFLAASAILADQLNLQPSLNLGTFWCRWSWYCMPQTVWTFNLRPKRLKTIGQNFYCAVRYLIWSGQPFETA